MSEKGYCNWCETLTNSIVKEYKEGRLVWSGCPDCYVKRKEKLIMTEPYRVKEDEVWLYEVDLLHEFAEYCMKKFPWMLCEFKMEKETEK